MKFISSDTNVWIDFYTINRLDIPFLLPATYLMHKSMISKELLSKDLASSLLAKGLKKTNFTDNELGMALEYNQLYKALSKFDATALAIAKNRNIPLLTGDKKLREAAAKMNVVFFGTIGLLDILKTNNLITQLELCGTLKLLLQSAQKRTGVLLPIDELEKRIKNFCN